MVRKIRATRTVWKTRNDFDRDFSSSYRFSKFDFKGEMPAPIGATIFKLSRKKTRAPRHVREALTVLDQLMLDSILWCHLMRMKLFKTKLSREHSNLARSLTALFGKVAQDAMVVRNLIYQGYDVQARNLLRSVDEHIDAIYYLCLRPEVSNEFVKTNNDDSSNQFWYKHLRKARGVIDQDVDRLLKGQLSHSFSEFRASERRMLSSAHHPSYVVSTVPFLVPYDDSGPVDYLLGIRSEYSYRTGRFLFYIMAEMSLILPLLNSDVKRVVESNGRSELQKLLRKLWLHLVRMLFGIIDNWDAPLFRSSKAMNDFMSTLPPDS